MTCILMFEGSGNGDNRCTVHNYLVSRSPTVKLDNVNPPFTKDRREISVNYRPVIPTLVVGIILESIIKDMES